MLAELRRIRTGDIDDRELDDTKNYLMGVFPATVQTASDIASRLVDMELYGLPEDYFDRYRENIAARDEGRDRARREEVPRSRPRADRRSSATPTRSASRSARWACRCTSMDIDGNMLPVG